VIYTHVRQELDRLRPHLAADAEVEFRVARFGCGEAGRRALQKLHEVLGVTVRAPSASLGELRLAGGLATRWLSLGREGLFEWRWVEEPVAAWLPPEPAAFAPLKGVTPPLGRRAQAAEERLPLVNSLPPLPAKVPEGAVVQVRCGGCGRVLDEPAATPRPARLPCPKCGSLARTRELVTAVSSQTTVGGRLRRIFGRTTKA
jgi:hypothetical protein